MKDGLKIYACSGLCNQIGTAPQDFQYWRDDVQTTNSTQAVNSLLAEINVLEAQLWYKEDITDEEVRNALGLIDLYVVCLLFAQKYTKEELPIAGKVIGAMVENGDFTFASLDDDERDKHLTLLCQRAEERFLAVDVEDIENNFTTWFNQNVTNKSVIGLSKAQRQAADRFFEKQKGIGATTNNDAADYLYNAGEFYLYLYMSRDEAYRQSYVIGKKWDKEKEVYDYIHKCYDSIYGSAEAVDKIIYSGICSQLKCTPEYAIKQLTGKESKGIGEPISAIISAIVSLIMAIVAAIKLIMTFVVSVVQAKYSVPTEAASGTPEGYEWEDIEAADSEKKTKIVKFGFIAAGIALLWSIFSKK